MKIGIYLALIVLVAGIILFFVMGKFSPKSNPQPSQIPIAQLLTQDTVTPQEIQQAQNQTAYAPGSLDKDFQRITSHTALSNTDLAIRKRLIGLLNNDSGTLMQSDSYILTYVKSPDVFMVEIRSNNADQAKKDALSWLTLQGLSTQGICNLPVKIYLGYDTNIYYKNNNLKFDSTPPGCGI